MHATARLLRDLLARYHGDLDRALRAYYGGPWDRGAHRTDRERYWIKVATRYAALKATHSATVRNPAKRFRRWGL